MALAGRSARRSAAGIRWIAIGLVISLFVLLIDASLNSRSGAPVQQLAAGAWYDRVQPLITSSTEEGQVVNNIWHTGPVAGASTIASQISGVVTGSSQLYKDILKVKPPTDLLGPAGLLEASLLARSEAAASLQTAFAQTLGAAYPGTKTAAVSLTAGANAAGTTVSQPVQALQTAAARMQVGDQAYQLFLTSLPNNLGVKFPSSAWLGNSAPYQIQTAQVFMTTLQNSVTITPVYQLRIYSVSTDPAEVSTNRTVMVLPDATAMTLTLVVANTGNQPQQNVTVTAAISPAGSGASSVVDYLSLTPGQAHSIVGLGPLNLTQGVTETLTIMAAALNTPTVTQTLQLQMPSTTLTPTTTIATSSSTIAPAGSGG